MNKACHLSVEQAFLDVICSKKKKTFEPGLVWLSGFSASLRTRGWLVQFPVRAPAWVVGWFPVGGVREATTR